MLISLFKLSLTWTPFDYAILTPRFALNKRGQLQFETTPVTVY
ncbi:hypothetical protein DSUL_40004 [Desulfovibrionales bacterium]